MKVRIVVADEREANFFDAFKPDSFLVPCGTLENPAAEVKDIDLEADRAGRRYGGAGGVSHGGGPQQGHHHGVDGERSTKEHDLQLFAKEVVRRIEVGRIHREFDKLVIVAPPKMLGLLRQSLSAQTQALLAAEIAKDLAHHAPDAVMRAVPRETFWQV